MHERENVVEAAERVTMEGWSLDPTAPTPESLVERAKSEPEGSGEVVIGLSREAVRILKPLDTAKLEKDLQKVYDRGIRGLAVCLMHSFTYPGEW